jgi:subtilisin family serine protease
MRSRSFLTMFAAALLCGSSAVVAAEPTPMIFSQAVRGDLARALQQAEPDELIQAVIIMRDQAPREQIAALRAQADKEFRRNAVRDLLKGIADRSQADLHAELRAAQAEGRVGDHIRAMWIHNMIGVRATRDVILRVAARDDVDYIIHDPPVGEEVFPFRIEHGEGPANIECGVTTIGADRVWNELNFTGAGVVVGVIDTGICRTHPDLANQIWINTGEIPFNQIDDDLNGFVDDVWGWNFENNNENVTDFHGHGTHVSGTVAGNGTNGRTTGVAPEAQIMTLKFWNSFSGQQTVWDSMQYGVDNGADILTASLGWPYSQNPDRFTWRTVCENSIAAGVVVIYAAGNEGSCCRPYGAVRCPGDVPDVISVGATDCNDNIASFSSRGPITWQSIAPWNDWPYPPGKIKPTISAPGVNTVSTSQDCSGYRTMSGTSMATPHVAGTVALMLEANPALDHDRVKELLKETAIDLGEPGPDNTFGWGRIDAYEAVLASMTGTIPLRLTATNLVAGVRCQADVARATPGEWVLFTYSLQGPGSTYVEQLNVTLDIANARRAGTRRADSEGKASLILRIDERAKGWDVWLQAAEFERTSNVVHRVVQ